MTPQTSTLNFPLGDVRANGVTVKLAANGSLSAVYAATAGSDRPTSSSMSPATTSRI